MLDSVANESFGMYRDALVLEMEKEGMVAMPKTRCLEITEKGVRIEGVDGEQFLEVDTVLYALGMKAVCPEELKVAAGNAKIFVVGDADGPAKVDKATRGGYLAGVEM